jgi:hypothetical protein
MFVSIPMGDLRSLAQSGYPEADAAVTFRTGVATLINQLVVAAKSMSKLDGKTSDLSADPAVKEIMDDLGDLAGPDVDFQGYIAREMNKGPLDNLLAAMRKGGVQSDILVSTYAVSDAVKTHTHADNILKALVFPKMTVENKGGAAIEVLLQVQALLRAAKTPEDVNLAIKVAVDHYKNKSDKAIPGRGHKKFAAEMQKWAMTA